MPDEKNNSDTNDILDVYVLAKCAMLCQSFH